MDLFYLFCQMININDRDLDEKFSLKLSSNIIMLWKRLLLLKQMELTFKYKVKKDRER